MSDGPDVPQLLDELVRLVGMQVRGSYETQREAIVEMHRAGISMPRIAELIGTSQGTVRDAVSRAARGR